MVWNNTSYVYNVVKTWLFDVFSMHNIRRSDILIQRPALCPSYSGGGRVVRCCWVNFQCRGVLLIWITVEQGPIALAVSAGGSGLDILLSSILSPLSPSLWDRSDIYWKNVSKGRWARSNQPNNQPSYSNKVRYAKIINKSRVEIYEIAVHTFTEKQIRQLSTVYCLWQQWLCAWVNRYVR